MALTFKKYWISYFQVKQQNKKLLDDEGEVEHFTPSPQAYNLSHAELKKSLKEKLQELKAEGKRPP